MMVVVAPITSQVMLRYAVGGGGGGKPRMENALLLLLWRRFDFEKTDTKSSTHLFEHFKHFKQFQQTAEALSSSGN